MSVLVLSEGGTIETTMHGEAPRSTSEDYAPLRADQRYGANEITAESLLSTYAHTDER